MERNGSQNPCEIDEKSKLHRGYVFEAFLGGLEALKEAKGDFFEIPFGDHFQSKIEKRHPNRYAKIPESHPQFKVCVPQR